MSQYNNDAILIHYGKGHLDGGHSGRYPWGSGKSSNREIRKAERALKSDVRATVVAKRNPGSLSDQDLAKEVKRLKLEKQYRDTRNELYPESDKLKSAKKIADSSSEFINRAKRMNDEAIRESQRSQKMDLSHMTDQQLRDKINRANLERQYSDLYGKESATVSKGQEYMQQILSYAGSVLAIGSSAIGIALAIKQLRG